MGSGLAMTRPIKNPLLFFSDLYQLPDLNQYGFMFINEQATADRKETPPSLAENQILFQLKTERSEGEKGDH